ncbi:rCG46810 [Rattus norvegicus]|uniref:RCG46810 n=1 Tax=Rattus norvegicus TaxID=10116 RepID=A6IXY5_RAT|nr:rCG46810 [Rattus norvegicus]
MLGKVRLHLIPSGATLNTKGTTRKTMTLVYSTEDEQETRPSSRSLSTRELRIKTLTSPFCTCSRVTGNVASAFVWSLGLPKQERSCQQATGILLSLPMWN